MSPLALTRLLLRGVPGGSYWERPLERPNRGGKAPTASGAMPVADESERMRAVKEGTEEEVVWQCNNLLHWLKPTPEAEERRTMVFCHMRDVLRRHGTGLEGAEVFLTG